MRKLVLNEDLTGDPEVDGLIALEVAQVWNRPVTVEEIVAVRRDTVAKVRRALEARGGGPVLGMSDRDLYMVIMLMHREEQT